MARPEHIRSVLLDASALIGIVTGEPAFARLLPLLNSIDAGEITLVESTAVLIEVRPRHASDDPRRARAREQMRALLESPSTRLVDVSVVVARTAGEIAADLGLKTWDAVHLATAIVADVDVLIARDGRFPEGDYRGVHVTGPFDLNDGNLLGLLSDDG